MPAVVIGAIVSAVGLTGVVATVATAALGAVASMAVQSMTARQKKPSSTLSSGRQIDLVRSSTEPRRIVYGQTRVSGPLAFAYTTNSPTGQKNYVLSMVVPLATHEVENIGALYVNDDRLIGKSGANDWVIPPIGSVYNANSKYNGVNGVHHIQWRVHLGYSDQVVDNFLKSTVPVWTVNHRLRGMAYVAVRLNWNSTVWASGLPNLSWEVKGKKVYDPRYDAELWSDNPALCLRDYLLSSYGLRCRSDEINEDSFIAAANICDELVNTADGLEQKRYTLNGVISLDEKPIDIIERMLTTCGGTLVYTQGQYRLYVAAYRTPVMDIDDSILRGPIVVYPVHSLQTKINTVRGTFIDPNKGWQATDFPQVSVHLEYDNGDIYAQDVELTMTTNTYEAQRLARLVLQRGRYPLTVELPCTLAALPLSVMNPVRLTLPSMGWNKKVFTPIEWTLTDDVGINLILQEDDIALYDWEGGVTPTEITPKVDLPSMFPEAPILKIDQLIANGKNILQVTVLSSLDAFISRSEVDYALGDDETLVDEDAWRSAGFGQVVTLDQLQPYKNYIVRAHTLNLLGMTSPWTYRRVQLASGNLLPADVLDVRASILDQSLFINWDAPDNSELLSYHLRWSAVTVGALWYSAIDIASGISGTQLVIPARAGTYFIKAVDSVFGRESENAATVVISSSSLQAFTNVATYTESPSYSGTKTNTSVGSGGQLIISSLGAFDVTSGNFDSPTVLFDAAGGGDDVIEGQYLFTASPDLGAVYLVRVAVNVQSSIIDYVVNFNDAAGDFDERDGQFDGSDLSTVNVLIEVATTLDNPSGSPTWSAWKPISLGDHVARGLKFRARLLSENLMATPAISALSLTISLADRTEAGVGLSSISTGSSITFTEAFKDTPAINVTGNNLQTGDYVSITSKSRTGFTVQFKNTMGTGVVRNYDWVARGYGRAQ